MIRTAHIIAIRDMDARQYRRTLARLGRCWSTHNYAAHQRLMDRVGCDA